MTDPREQETGDWNWVEDAWGDDWKAGVYLALLFGVVGGVVVMLHTSFWVVFGVVMMLWADNVATAAFASRRRRKGP